MPNKPKATPKNSEDNFELRPIMIDPGTYKKIKKSAGKVGLGTKTLISKALLICCERPEEVNDITDAILNDTEFSIVKE